MDSASDLDASTPSRPATAPAAGPSFAQLARRISGAASNLLAMALVLLLGLTLGREVISWWRADEVTEQAAAASSAKTPAPKDVVQIGVGAAAPLVMRSVVGDRTQALAMLAEMAREHLQHATATSGEPSAEEARLLEKIGASAPREEAPAGSIYELRGDVPLTIAVAKPTAGSSARRVVFCGLALDKGDSIWNLYGLAHIGADQAGEQGEIPWPPGTQRVMSLASGAQGSTLVFVGAGDEQAWVKYYREWFAKHEAEVVLDWRLVGTRWQATYQLAGTRQLVELILCPQSDGRWTGLATTNPSQPVAQHR